MVIIPIVIVVYKPTNITGGGCPLSEIYAAFMAIYDECLVFDVFVAWIYGAYLGMSMCIFVGWPFFGEVYGDLWWFHEFKKDLADVRMASSSIKRVQKMGMNGQRIPEACSMDWLNGKSAWTPSLKSRPLEVSCNFSPHRWLATAEKPDKQSVRESSKLPGKFHLGFHFFLGPTLVQF